MSRMMDFIRDGYELCDKIISNGGEMSPAEEEFLRITNEGAAEKMERLYYFANTAAAQAEHLEKQVADVLKTAKALKDRAAWGKLLIKQYLQATGQAELSGAIIRAILTDQGQKLVIKDINALPEECTTTQRVENREAILKLIEAGHQVPGASLEQVSALRFYVSKEQRK